MKTEDIDKMLVWLTPELQQAVREMFDDRSSHGLHLFDVTADVPYTFAIAVFPTRYSKSFVDSVKPIMQAFAPP